MRRFVSGFFLLFLVFQASRVQACPGSANFSFPTPWCMGAAVTFTNTSTGAASGYVWVWGDATANTAAATTAAQTHSFAAVGTYTVFLVRNFASGCSDTLKKSIHIVNTPPPAPTFTFTPAGGCSNLPFHFTNTTGNAALTYNWNFGDPGSGAQNTASTTSVTHSFAGGIGSGTTSFTISLTAVSNIGCSTTATQTVLVNNRPNAALADSNVFSPFNNCGNATASNQAYYVAVQNGSTTLPSNSNYNLNWGDGTPNFNSSTFTQTSHTYAALGLYNIVLVVTGTNGCTDTVRQLVVNQTNPSVGLSGPGSTAGCAPQSYTFTLSPDINNINYTTYVFYFGDNTPPVTLVPPIPSPATVTHVFNTTSCGQPANQFTVKVTAHNACDSTTATVNNIKISTKPQAHFIPVPNPGCVNVPVSFNNTTVAGCYVTGAGTNSTSSFTWSFGDGTPNVVTTSTAAPAHTYTVAGSYTVSLSASNPCGSSTFSVVERIFGPPVALFSHTPPGCAPVVVSTTNLSTKDSLSYTWSASPAAGWSFTGGTNAQSTDAQFSFTAAGTYTIQLTTSNPCGSNTDTMIVLVREKPAVSFAHIPDACGSTTFSPAATYTSNGTPITSYSWTFPGGTPASSTLPAPGPIVYTVAGTYTVSVSAANACGTSTASQVIHVFPLPLAEAGNDTTICQGQSAVIGSPIVAGLSYNWVSNPAGFSSTASSTTVTPPVTTSYILTVSDGNACVASDTLKVTVTPAPVVSAGSAQTVCINASPFNLSGTPAGGTWSGTGISNAANGTFSAALSGLGTFTITYTLGGAGCPGKNTVPITVVPLPVVNAGNGSVYCNQPGSATLAGYSPTGGTWSGPGVSAAGVFTPTLAGVGNFVLTYTYTDANSCSASDTIHVQVVSPAVAVAGANDTVCVNSGAYTLSGFSPAGGSWSGTGITNPTGTFDPAVSGSGSFVLTYQYGSGTCASTATKTIHVNPLPVVSAGANQALCISTPNFLLTGFSPAGGVWSGTGITNAITGQFDPAVSGVGTFTLSYSFTNSVTHCTGVSTKQITVNPLPVVNAGTGSTYCNAPIPVTLTGYTPAGGSWSGAGVLIGGTFTPSAAGNGLTVLSYSFTDVNGCSATDTIQVRVVAPALAIAGNNDTVCIGSGLLTLSGFSPAGGNWTGTGITNASGVFNPAVSGVGSFTLTYSYGVGTCANSSTKTVVVHALPVVSAGADRVSCINVPAFNLSGASPAGGVWTGTGITNAALGTFNPATAGAGTFTMTYTFTDPVTHCLNTATVKETVNPIPVVNAGTGTTYCNQPIPLTLTGYTPTGGTWSGTGVSASGVFNPAVPGNGPVVLTYSFTDANGCISQDTLNEKVISPALALAGPTDTICINAGLLTLNGFSPAGGTWSGTGITNPTGIFDPVIAGVGSHSIVYSYGAGTCFNTSSKNVIVHAAPVVLAGGNEITCISTPPYTLSGFSPAGGTWTGTGITNGVAATFSPSNAGAGTFTLTYSFTSPITHCTSTASKTVTVGALPIVQFTNPNPGCIAAPVLFTDNTTGASTYAWNFGDGGQSAIQTPAYSYAAAGTYTIHLVATTTLGCKDSAKSTLVILPNPRAVFTTTPDSGCSPLSVSFVNSSVVANGTISWNLGNGQSSTALTPPPQTYLQGINDTLYHVSLTITNQCAVSTAKDSVRIHPKPEAGFGTNVSSGCSPATFAFHNTTTGLPKTFNWNFGDGTTGTGPLPPAHTYTYTGKKDTVYVIQLIATNSCGTDTASQQVIVYPNTVKAFFNTSSVSGCVPHSVTFSNFSTGGNSIAWNFGDGNISTQTNPTHIYLTPGTYTVSQFVTNGCSYDTARNVITVHPNAALVFSAAPTPACVSHAVLFTNASTNAGGFVWHFGDGTTSTVNSPTHSYATAGSYTVTLVGTSTTFGCIDSTTQVVKADALPVPLFTKTVATGCLPLNVVFSNTSTNAAFYIWNFGDGNTSSLLAPSHIYTQAGTYTITLIAQSSGGCTDSIKSQITVYPLPEAAFKQSSDTSCTVPILVNFSNASTGATSYAWNFGNGQVASNVNGNAAYGANGTYTIQLISTTSFGCSDTATSHFLVSPAPVANFSIGTLSGCQPLAVTFANQSQPGITYSWSFGDGGHSQLTSPTYVYNSPGTYSVQLTATSAAGCSNSQTISPGVTVLPTPEASFSYNQQLSGGKPVGTIAFVNTSTGGLSNSWNFGDQGTSKDPNPVHQYAAIGDYMAQLIVTNSAGCSDTVNQKVLVEYFQGLFVPNAFIPGSSFGEAAIFKPKGKSLRTYHIQIFNTWGTLLWESTALDANGSPAEFWDGTYQGIPCQQDAYVWKVDAIFENGSVWAGKKYPGGATRNTGTVTLIR